MSTSPWPPLLRRLGGRLDASLDPAHAEPQCGYQQMTGWSQRRIVYEYVIIYLCICILCVYIVYSTYVHICAMVQRWYMVYGHNIMRIHPLIWVHNPSIILNMAHIIWKQWKHSKGLCVCATNLMYHSGIFSDMLEQKQTRRVISMFKEGHPHFRIL